MLRASERRTFYQRIKFSKRDIAIHRRHAAVGAGNQVPGRNVLQRPADGMSNLLRRLNLIARNIDHTKQDILTLEQPQELDRHA